MFLGITGFSQIPSDTTLDIHIFNLSKARIALIASNAEPNVMYELQYKQSRTNWFSLGFSYGDWRTKTTVFGVWTNRFIPNTNLMNLRAFRVRSWKSRGDYDIPYWWLFKYFGDVDIDVFSSPMNDGWSIFQDYQKGMNPFEWYPPPEEVEFNLEFQKSGDAKHTNAILTLLCNTREVPDRYIIERANRATGQYQTIGQMPGRLGVWNRYVDTNADSFPEPVYHVHAHYPEPPPPFAELDEVTLKSIRSTILSVTARQTTNGYELTVHHPLIRARYLLLVRDKLDPEWRASGYFVSGTNGDPVYLHADRRGMMTDIQSPITLPPVNFLPNVVQPEFTAGWGEDTDGDGLPDIYEVLVTHTDPDDADTGDTGTSDGFRVFADDGWNNWEKFRYRANPFKKYEPPSAIVLKKPTDAELLQAQVLNTDLPYQLQLEIRTNSSADFQPFSVLVNAQYLNHDRTGHARCDVRISWKVPPPEP